MIDDKPPRYKGSLENTKSKVCTFIIRVTRLRNWQIRLESAFFVLSGFNPAEFSCTNTSGRHINHYENTEILLVV
jgi:hypothetical protein